MASVDHSEIFVTAQDGLKLYVRAHGRRSAPGLPVVCLPGLARNPGPHALAAPGFARRPRYLMLTAR